MISIQQLKASAFDVICDGLTPRDIDAITGLGLDVATRILEVSTLGIIDLDTFEEFCENRSAEGDD